MAARKALDFGGLLRHHRIAAGLTQDELAERAGLSARAVSDLERGLHRAPHRDTMRRLADALGLAATERQALLAGRFPRTKPAGRGQRARGGESTLPVPLTSFIGRERAVTEVKRLLASGRLLTLIGSGGVGKTRLAVSVAHESLTDGRAAGGFVAFADLTPLADPDLVPQTVAAQLGVPEQPGRPVLPTLIDALQDETGLLVLDNCEHLVQACAVLAHELLTACSDYLAVESLSEQGRDLWHTLGNAAQEAFCLFTLGQATIRLGKYAAARAYLEAGLALSRAAGHGGAEANCLFSLAELAAELGNYDDAYGWADAALARATEIGQQRQIAVARRMLGLVSLRQGNYAAAAGWLEGSLTTHRELGELWWIAQTLVPLAQLAIERGELGVARTHLTESLSLAQELGDQLRTAEGLEGFVQVAALEGRPRLALQLGAAAEAVRESIRVPVPPSERARLERYLANARSALGGRAAERARVEGHALGRRQAIDLALSGTKLSTVDHPAKRQRAVLTGREQGVARLVAEGLTNRQIAERLVIAEGTAERHIGNILGKLEMNARTQIAAWAVAHGLVPSEIPADV